MEKEIFEISLSSLIFARDTFLFHVREYLSDSVTG